MISPARRWRDGGVTGVRACMLVAGLLVVAGGCAGVPRAYFDSAAAGGIVWPGPPERPRVRYAWSLHLVEMRGSRPGERTLGDLLFGSAEENERDPAFAPFLVRPNDIVADGERIVISDPGAYRVTVIDRKEGTSTQIRSIGGEPFVFPLGVAMDAAGTIAVTDPDRKVVAIYTPDGTFVRTLGGEWLRPTGVAADKRGKGFYVVDTWAHKVCRVNATDGEKVCFGSRGGGEGEFNFPTDIAVGADGKLYVVDALNFRIQVFDGSGTFLRQFGTHGDTYADLEKPRGVAVDAAGRVYVTDAAQGMVKIYDTDGRLLLYVGKEGRRLGQFRGPSGIWIDDRGVLYIADGLNMRVQALELLGGDVP